MTTNIYTKRSINATNTIDTASLLRLARIAGVLYLIIIIAGMFGDAIARESLIVQGDATTTAQNIINSEGLFRASIIADLIMIMADVAIGLTFYYLLKPVNKALSLLAAMFRLAQAATLGINLLMLFFVLQLLSGADYLGVLGSDQLNAQAMLFLNAHAIGYKLALVFFAVGILIQGYLLYNSGYFPKILGTFVIFAALGYFIDNFATFILPDYEAHASLFEAIVLVSALNGEVGLAVWLLVKGIIVKNPDGGVRLAGPQTEAQAG